MEPVEFEVHGPFKLPPDSLRWISSTVRKEFWDADDELQELRKARGCYVYAVSRQGGGFVPWYVGQSCRSFEAECFTDNKLRILNEGLPRADSYSGGLMLFLVAYQRRGRGRVNATAIQQLETLLIQLAEKKNDELLNVHGRRRTVLRIPGVLDPAIGRPPQAATRFKSMLGVLR